MTDTRRKDSPVDSALKAEAVAKEGYGKACDADSEANKAFRASDPDDDEHGTCVDAVNKSGAAKTQAWNLYRDATDKRQKAEAAAEKAAAG